MTSNMTSVQRFAHIQLSLTQATSRTSLLSNVDFRRDFFGAVDNLITSHDAVLSLDIFDTLLLRDDSAEITRFVEIGNRMMDILDGKYSSSDAHTTDKRSINGFLARYLGTTATYRARKRVQGAGEGSLNEIHSVASRLLTGDVDYRDAFIEAELRYESTRMAPNSLILEYVRHHKRNGGKVILVTDMYMHEEQVYHLLELLDISTNVFDMIISSADTTVSKASGGIFGVIQKRMDIPANKFVHLGDSLKGDFQRPMEHGWKALHLPVPDIELQQRLEDHTKTEKLLRQFGIYLDIAPPHVEW